MTDPMLTYYRQHREWLYPGLDDIKKQMPRIRSKYPGYAVFASHTFAEVFPPEQRQPAVHKKAEMFQSVYLVNDGSSGYTLHDLPDEVQFSPVYGFVTADVNGDGFKDILAVGNFYGNTPMGKSDSLWELPARECRWEVPGNGAALYRVCRVWRSP